MLQSRIFVGMVLILIFGEVLGLYGYANLPKTGLNSYLTKLVSLLLSFSTQERIEYCLSTSIYLIFIWRRICLNIIYQSKTGIQFHPIFSLFHL